MPDFTVVERFYSCGILGIAINGDDYEYLVSPFTAERFRMMLRFNKGKAINILRGMEVCYG